MWLNFYFICIFLKEKKNQTDLNVVQVINRFLAKIKGMHAQFSITIPWIKIKFNTNKTLRERGAIADRKPLIN